MQEVRLHILGASGAGTSTLGRELAAGTRHPHFDTDDFYWLPTSPPYQTPRPRSLRRALLQNSVAAPSWILSGSLCGWGDVFIPAFTHVVFLSVPTDVRVRRLQSREVQRYGKTAIAPGGTQFQQHGQFMQWAASYDDGDLSMRSRQLHDQWLRQIRCPTLILEGDVPVADLSKRVIEWLDR